MGGSKNQKLPIADIEEALNKSFMTAHTVLRAGLQGARRSECVYPLRKEGSAA
jgi:hypothetical protein